MSVFIRDLGGGILPRRHRDDCVLAFFAIGFRCLQDELVLVQAKVRSLSDGKQDRMFVIFRLDVKDGTNSLHVA